MTKLKANRVQIEWLPLVNTEGRIIGKGPRHNCHKGMKILHPVVHLHILNEGNELFLQKRAADKLVQPGKWDTAVGGHVSFGDSIREALIRETEEELGVKINGAEFMCKYPWETALEQELVYMFRLQINTRDSRIKINKQELEDGRFWTQNELIENIGKEIFTPNLEYELKKIFPAALI